MIINMFIFWIVAPLCNPRGGAVNRELKNLTDSGYFFKNIREL